MYTKQSKKMLPFDVLEVLKKYSDINHRLSQREIEKILADKYDMIVDRRSVKRSIMDLIEMGVEIQYTEIIRNVKDKSTGQEEEQSILTDFYLERVFSDCEIRLLIDELLDNKYIPAKQRKQLITKLEDLSSVYYRKSKKSFGYKDYGKSSTQLFYTIDVVNEAITLRNRISFNYKSFYAGKTGSVEVGYDLYTVIPYEMIISDGDYLLICSENADTELYLRMDYISDVFIVDEKTLLWNGKKNTNGFSAEKKVEFLADEDSLTLFVEEFGQNAIRVERCNKNNIFLSIKTDEKKATEFGIVHFDTVTVLAPEAIRLSVINRLQYGIGRYAVADKRFSLRKRV